MKLIFIILCYSNTAAVKHFKILKNLYRARDTIQTLFKLHNLVTSISTQFCSHIQMWVLYRATWQKADWNSFYTNLKIFNSCERAHVNKDFDTLRIFAIISTLHIYAIISTLHYNFILYLTFQLSFLKIFSCKLQFCRFQQPSIYQNSKRLN